MMAGQTEVVIRVGGREDYGAVAAVVSAARPGRAVTVASLVAQDEARAPYCRFARLVAERAGEVIGCARYTQYADIYRPGEFWVDGAVLPAWQRQGVGRALAEALLADVQQWEPRTLLVTVGEEEEAGVRFLEGLGFEAYARRWESYLEVAGFDAGPYGEVGERLAAQGIVFKAVSELGEDPRRDEKLHELQWALDQEVPGTEPVQPVSLEQFRKQVVDHPAFVADGSFVALDGEDYVGMSSFFVNRADNSLGIDLTGTLPAYRRRGIGLALKLRGIRFAQEGGYGRIVVQNDEGNVGMLALNGRLGFVRRPALVKYRRVLGGVGE